MKIAYIAHPISGDIKGNLKRIEVIGRQININEPEVIPFPHYALMRIGFIDEIRLYGDRISAGMSHEVNLAMELGIDVKPMTEATKLEFAERWQNTESN